MQITHIETYPVRIPLKPERIMITSLGRHAISDYLLVRVLTDTGIEGVGEATVDEVAVAGGDGDPDGFGGAGIVPGVAEVDRWRGRGRGVGDAGGREGGGMAVCGFEGHGVVLRCGAAALNRVCGVRLRP